jgi:hypothetical protein
MCWKFIRDNVGINISETEEEEAGIDEGTH